MSHLRNRILNQGRATNANAHLGKDYNAPLERPLIRIAIMPGGVSYMQNEQLFTPDGRLIPQTDPGTWGQLFKAGTP